jgi:cytochrome c biogenesis protein CcdA
MGELLVGTTLLASFLGGVVALLAPCCVSVMLPAYLSTGFRHRGGVVPATLVFGAGVATLILPIGLGATALSRLLFGGHVWVFSIGGALMIAAGIAVLAGWSPNLPMPGARAARTGSYRSAYLLGVFSGAASACCAPVLSDPDLAVSHAYDANQYGMMGDMRDGHSFVLVGPDGVIEWRADYGGAPKYTMFLPTDKMLSDLTAERVQ